MNSRLAYQMIPDIKRLEDPPALVVQLHVEEPEREGYVRYVCTRYGNLVDAWSVVSDHLAAAMADYDVPARRLHVIRLGADTEATFDPGRVEPVGSLAPALGHVLYPGRLTAQKDPLLMVEIAAVLRDRGVRFQVHSVGEGDLRDQVAEAIRVRGLEDTVLLHGGSNAMPGWYAACD